MTQRQWRQLARAGQPRFELDALIITDPDRLWDALEIAHWFDRADRVRQAGSLRLVGGGG